MFPRAARFDSERNSDVPGPNTYDPSTPESQYKRGAMFEKDARFRQQRASLSVISNGASPIASTSKVQLDTRLVSLEKEKFKLEQRANKAEEKVKELQTDALTWSREKKQMQIDHRLLLQKYEKSQARTTGQTQHMLEIQELRQRLQALEAKSTEEQNQIERLNLQLARSEAERCAAQELADEFKTKCKAAENQMERCNEQMDALQFSFDQKRNSMEQKREDLLRRIEDMNDRLKLAENEREAGRSQIAALIEKNYLLESQNDDEEEEEEEAIDVSALEKQRSALVSVSLRLASENSLLKHTCSQNAIESKHSTIRLRRLENCLRERDGEIAHLTSTLANLKSELSIHESRLIRDDMEDLYDPFQEKMLSSNDRNLDSFVREHQEQQTILQELDRQDAQLTIQQQNLHLEWKQNIIERLQLELEQSRSRQAELESEVQESAGLQDNLKFSHNNLMALEEAYEVNMRECQDLRENEDFLKMEIDRLHDEVGLISQRMQGVEGMDDRLYQASIREKGLLDDRQELLDDLARASNYESAYYTIRAEAQKLLTRLRDYNLDSSMFTTMNAALTSNKNPTQKIAYLDRLRTQLDETRIAYRLMEQERNKLHKQYRELQDLNMNKSPQHEQIPVSIQNNNAPPLDEREAAKRAWQARPKARSSRSSRHSDSSSRGPQLRERPSRSRMMSTQHQHTMEDVPPIPVQYHHLEDGQSDLGEGTSLLSNGTTLFEQQHNATYIELADEPKRRYLRPQKSNGFLNDVNRASPVVSLPSIDALAWELDKENLLDKQQQYQQSNSTLPSRLLEGELTFQDLAGI